MILFLNLEIPENSVFFRPLKGRGTKAAIEEKIKNDVSSSFYVQ